LTKTISLKKPFGRLLPFNLRFGGEKLKAFIHDDFLLNNEPGKILYHEYAKHMPIIDYHCHLDPKEIVENKPFTNLTQAWLTGDHYKWRAMRSAGIEEKYITGDASDKEKFLAWAKTVPQTIGNPLYHWTHLELKRYFNVDLILNEETGEEIWEHCNRILLDGAITPQSLIKQSNVKMIGTTDGPIDTLEYHLAIRSNENIEAKVLPSFRPDPAIEISKPTFSSFVEQLGEISGAGITSFQQYLDAIEVRVSYFHEIGCRISDHGFEGLVFAECTSTEAAAIFQKKLTGESISILEENKFKTFMMVFLGKQYADHNWVMQLHIGALRDNSTRMFNQIGANTGFDSISDVEMARPLNRFLDELDKNNQLPKTIVYNLNPAHNYVISSAVGNFQGGGIRGKIQFGSGWWFNDHKDGMIRQITDLATVGLLSHFVGMLTDSRSFLSYTRHEYFRRILCDLFGQWVERGEVPMDYSYLGKIIQDICFNNASAYFGLTE
jgi:glucuronate isomerase